MLEEGLARDLYDAMELPAKLVLDILMLRGYAQAKAQVEAPGAGDKTLPPGPMTDMVYQVQAALLRRRRLGQQ